jgi:hypothetical protein
VTSLRLDLGQTQALKRRGAKQKTHGQSDDNRMGHPITRLKLAIGILPSVHGGKVAGWA